MDHLLWDCSHCLCHCICGKCLCAACVHDQIIYVFSLLEALLLWLKKLQYGCFSFYLSREWLIYCPLGITISVFPWLHGVTRHSVAVIAQLWALLQVLHFRLKGVRKMSANIGLSHVMSTVMCHVQLLKPLTSRRWIILMESCSSAGRTGSCSSTCPTPGCCTGRLWLWERKAQRRATLLMWVIYSSVVCSPLCFSICLCCLLAFKESDAAICSCLLAWGQSERLVIISTGNSGWSN